MVTISGVKSVYCTCGREMTRVGGVFSSSVSYSTYVCGACKKAVNVIDIDPEKLLELMSHVK